LAGGRPPRAPHELTGPSPPPRAERVRPARLQLPVVLDAGRPRAVRVDRSLSLGGPARQPGPAPSRDPRPSADRDGRRRGAPRASKRVVPRDATGPGPTLLGGIARAPHRVPL